MTEAENPAVKPVEPLRMIEGPISWVVNGRNFTMTADVDTKEKQALTNWMTERLMYQWRKLVLFQKIESTVVGSIPNSLVDIELQERKRRDNDRDEYLYTLTGEWVTLENVLVAHALRLEDPNEAEFIRSISGVDKLKIINIQDRLNGFDVIQKMTEIKNMHALSARLQEVQDKQVEEKAKHLLEEMRLEGKS